MTDDDTPRTLVFAGAGIIAVGCAIVAALGLGALARPADFAARLSEVRGKIGLLEASNRTPARPVAYAKDAACPEADAAQVAAIEQRVKQTAAGSGVTVTALALTPINEASSSITPLRLRLEASGPYDKLVTLLGGLASGSPQVFVDRLDLRESGGAVHLSLTSKVYCWSDARS